MTLNKLELEKVRLIRKIETMERELEVCRKEVHQSNLFVRKLAMVVAHDLQSPFRFVVSSSEKMQNLIEERDFDQLKTLNRDLMNSGRHVISFISDFLLWIKSIDSRYKPKKQEVNVYELVAELHTFYHEMLGDRSNTLLYDDLEKNMIVVTDRQLLRIIIRNLLDNANKYNLHGIIHLSVSATDRHVTLSIKDTGEGIPENDLATIQEIIKNKKSHLIDFDHKYGFKIIKHFSELLGIKLNVCSNQSCGTKIELRITAYPQ